jgi:hypothetical protein
MPERDILKQGFVEKIEFIPFARQFRPREQDIVRAIGIENLPLVA